jgi:hypothetical protein
MNAGPFFWMLLLTLAAVPAACPAAAPENWPMYNHDPSLSGRTGEFVTGKLTLKWERQFPTGAHVRAQPIIVDGAVYQGIMNGDFFAIDIETGKNRWSMKTGGLIFGSAAVSEGRVVVPVYYPTKGELRALALDGRQAWTLRSDEPFFASPIVAGGLIYIGDLGGTVWCVQAADGKVVWRQTVGGRVLGPIAVAEGTAVLQADDMKGYALDAASGRRKWTVDLPGERVGHAHPLIARGTVIFTVAPRATHVNALDGEQPGFGELPLSDASFKKTPKLSLEEVVARTAALQARHAEAASMLAVGLADGKRRFATPLPTPYWGMITPCMLTDRLLLKQCWQVVLTMDVTNGEIRMLGSTDMLVRGDEYTYGVVGGRQTYYGAIADDLVVKDYRANRNAATVNDIYTHGVDSWQHPPDAVNRYLTAPGPGDGNSGYVGTPIPYGGKIVWQYCGSWLRCDQGSGGNEFANGPAGR